MSSVRRVYVEKKAPYAVKARELADEIRGYLGVETVTDVRIRHLQLYFQSRL